MEQQQAYALGLLAEVALHHGLDPGAPAERYQVVVHVDAPVLADASQPGQSVLEEGGQHVPAGTSQRLACDATRVVMWHDAGGRVTEVVPADVDGGNSCADIHVAPSGRFVYSSNRGHDSIAIFAVDEASGTLAPRGHASTGGSTPRNFAIDPRGNFLLAANQQSDSIVSFRVDQVRQGRRPHQGLGSA